MECSRPVLRGFHVISDKQARDNLYAALSTEFIVVYIKHGNKSIIKQVYDDHHMTINNRCPMELLHWQWNRWKELGGSEKDIRIELRSQECRRFFARGFYMRGDEQNRIYC